MYKKFKIIFCLFLLATECIAQMGIGTKTPHYDAMLEIASTSKGLLLPRVVLNSTASPSPLSSHVAGMCVFNSASTSDVTAGYYYNNGSKWIRLSDESTSSNITLNGTEPINITNGIVSLNNTGVTTDKLSANAVTENKIADNAITSSKIANASIQTEDLADNSITISKLPPGASSTSFLRGDGTWSNTNSSIDITATEVALPYKIDGKQLYAIKGSFTANGSSVTVTINIPPGMTGYYSFTSYKDGKTFRRDIISFDVNTTSNNVVTGSGFIAEAYPVGEYNYVLEYFK